MEISANLSRLDSGLKRAKADTNKFLKGVSKDMESLNFMPLVKNIGLIGWQFAQITAPITAVTGALFALQKYTANVGEELLKMKEKTGISVEELYSLKKVAELSDISLSTLGIGLKILSQNIIEARTETSEMNRIFKALGIDTSRPLIEIFTQLSGRFSSFREGTEKLDLAVQLFGRSGQDLIPVMNDIADSGLKVSTIFTEDTAKAAAEFNDNLRELKQVAEEVGFAIGNSLIPSTSNFLKNMQSVRGFFLQFFPEILIPLEKLRDLGDDAWNKYVRGIETATEKTKEFQAATRGATSLRDLPFSFGGEPFQPKEPVPVIPPKETKKDTKDAEREAIRTANAIRDAYADMYEALKFNSRNYYEYQKGLLEKRREEEIEITGDIELAWQAFNARMQELEEQRLANSQSMLDGVRLFYAEMRREGFTYAQATKDAMADAQQGMSSTFFQGWKNLIRGEQSFKDSFFSMIEGMADAWIDAVLRMMAQWQAFQTMRGIGSIFGFSSFAPQGESGAQALFGHDGGYVRSFHRGGLARDEIPAVLQAGEYVMSRRGVAALDQINNGNIGKGNMNVAINVENQTGQQVSMENQGARFDGERYVVNVILKNLNSNGALRNAFAGLK